MGAPDGAPAAIRVTYTPDPDPPEERWGKTPWAGFTFAWLNEDGSTISESNPNPHWDPDSPYVAVYKREL